MAESLGRGGRIAPLGSACFVILRCREHLPNTLSSAPRLHSRQTRNRLTDKGNPEYSGALWATGSRVELAVPPSWGERQSPDLIPLHASYFPL